MARKIVWTEPALNDLDAIADYIALDKPLAAKSLVQKIFKSASLLKSFPMPYRQLVIPPCRLFYRIHGETITIVSVIRSERKLGKDLLDRD